MTGLAQYDYDLPKELIAQRPLPNRTDARLLVVDRRAQTIDHAHVRDLPDLLQNGDHLVVNDTRVIPARIAGFRESTGGHFEGLFLRSDESGNWHLLCKSRSRLKAGELIHLTDQEGKPAATLRLIIPQEEGGWCGRLVSHSAADPLEILNQIGRVPLPRYIRKGAANPEDLNRYQTEYARHPGAIAAPTAGLHLSLPLLEKLKAKGLGMSTVTLHVGVGTFQPIKGNSLDEHAMHQETGRITQDVVDTLNRVRQSNGRIMAVGTTTVRVLETAARSGSLSSWSGASDLFIRPPYQFRAVDILLTNFHLPRTTLLVLVMTFAGEELIRKAYQAAIEERYRFYSYGDAMLIM